MEREPDNKVNMLLSRTVWIIYLYSFAVSYLQLMERIQSFTIFLSILHPLYLVICLPIYSCIRWCKVWHIYWHCLDHRHVKLWQVCEDTELCAIVTSHTYLINSTACSIAFHKKGKFALGNFKIQYIQSANIIT